MNHRLLIWSLLVSSGGVADFLTGSSEYQRENGSSATSRFAHAAPSCQRKAVGLGPSTMQARGDTKRFANHDTHRTDAQRLRPPR
jgi:hypothetical protein